MLSLEAVVRLTRAALTYREGKWLVEIGRYSFASPDMDEAVGWAEEWALEHYDWNHERVVKPRSDVGAEPFGDSGSSSAGREALTGDPGSTPGLAPTPTPSQNRASQPEGP